MPDWLRTTVWIVGVLALLLTVVVGYLMWRYPIPPRGLFAMGVCDHRARLQVAPSSDESTL